MSTDSKIKLEQVSKTFGKTPVLLPIDLEIASGEMLALLGPSGSGKTTLLRMIAGLESCEQGQIFFGDKEVTHLHVRKRKVGFVFQHYALFQHLTIADNIAFGLKVLPRKERPSKAEIADKVASLLKMVKLDGLGSRYPNQLSGGQKQRVALARALATEPDVLLLDEPFGALDAQVRDDLRQWLRHLHNELKFTSIFVTHDQEEAFELADRVAILHDGVIEQVDTPTKLYQSPANAFVFNFLGKINVFSGQLETHQHHGQPVQSIVQNGVKIHLPQNLDNHSRLTKADGQTMQIYFRAHELFLSSSPVDSSNLEVVISSINPVGAEIRIGLDAKNFTTDKEWQVQLTHFEYETMLSENQISRGQTYYLKPKVAHLFQQADDKPHHLYW